MKIRNEETDSEWLAIYLNLFYSLFFSTILKLHHILYIV